MRQMQSEQFEAEALIQVPHVVKGRALFGTDVRYRSRDLGADFATPRLDLDDLVWSRTDPLPCLNMPVTEIIDFMEQLGARLDLDRNVYLQEALEGMVKVSELGRRILVNCYRDMPNMFRRDVLMTEVVESLGGTEVIDGWKSRNLHGHSNRIRAFPPRLVHVLAGNSPLVAAMTIARSAVSKGVHLLKLPSNDLFTATAILRTMADIDPEHPVTRSFSAVYWKGGDERIESVLCRAQYFDKMVVWGGEAAVRHALKYIGPGFELVSNDPKVSMSMIGHEAFESEESLREVARRGAADVLSFNQDACNASRYQFVEGTIEEVDRYCVLLAEALQVDVRFGNGQYKPTPQSIRDEADVLRMLEPVYAVFGSYDGKGLVIRSEDPVGFHPDVKTVNVIRVDDLAKAVRYATVATKTLGIWPSHRRLALRDALAGMGVQQIVTLGEATSAGGFGGMPHDAYIPLHRVMRWISDQGEE